VIYAGIETSPMPPAPPDGEAPFRLGVLTRLVPLKNVECVIRSVSRLVDQGVNLELEIAGTGPSEPELRLFAADLGLDRRVRFLGWQPEVRALLERWNLLVIASDEESFPFSALEAMARARPVLATRAGGLPELIADGITGRLIPPRDEDAMTSAIAEFAAHRDTAAQMGLAGWQRAREEFSSLKMALQTVQLYDRLLEHSHGEHG
jgi:glycosyltransferase involved in cell wall biosynthesis